MKTISAKELNEIMNETYFWLLFDGISFTVECFGFNFFNKNLDNETATFDYYQKPILTCGPFKNHRDLFKYKKHFIKQNIKLLKKEKDRLKML